MKKVILGSVLAVVATASLDAAAATTSFCSGGSASSVNAPTTTTSTFHRTAFSIKCSANVHLVGDDQTTYYRVGAASVKGKSKFGGSTLGGAVSNAGACAATTGCVATDASSAATSAASS